MAAMRESELKALLQAEKNDALGVNTSSLATERARALDYYYGNMRTDMPSQDGRSSAVSTDVSDTVEGLMPALMEIFAATEEAVKFNPVGPEDEQGAVQETDYVNHVFMQKNMGFLILYSFIKDALLSKIGVAKVFWDETESEETETYHDVEDDQFALLVASPDVEVTEHAERDDEATGQKVHDVTLVTKRGYGCAKVEPVPPEEFGISKWAKSIQSAGYCYHEPTGKTQNDLIEQGYDRKQIEKLPSINSVQGVEEQSRNTIEDKTDTENINRAMRLIKVVEHYVRMDYDGAGKAKLYRVTTGGDQGEILKRDGKLDVVPVDVMPFAAMTPVIITHRFFGRSIADLVLDIQRIKTALLRALLDNAYLANNQRVAVDESYATERTIDDLLIVRPGGIVRTKGPAITPIENQPIGNFAFPLIEYIDSQREFRSGVTRQGQGVDANALQNQSATAVNQAFTAAQAKMKLIARIFAETGIRDLFALLHGVIRKNDKKANTVRLRNKWVTVDPRSWKTRDDMTITVGLGTGSKEAQIQHLMNILGIQKEMKLGRMATVTDKNIYNTAAKLTEKSDQKNPELFFTDPESPEGQKVAQDLQAQQPQDPKILQITTQAQLDEKADQRKAGIEQVQAQADIATNQQKIAAETQQNEREFQLKKELAIMTAQLEMQKFEREEARKDREHQQKMDLARETHGAQMQSAEFGLVAGKQAHDQKMEQMKQQPAREGA